MHGAIERVEGIDLGSEIVAVYEEERPAWNSRAAQLNRMTDEIKVYMLLSQTARCRLPVRA